MDLKRRYLVACNEVGVERALCTAALRHLVRALHRLTNDRSLDEHSKAMLDGVSSLGSAKMGATLWYHALRTRAEATACIPDHCWVGKEKIGTFSRHEEQRVDEGSRHRRCKRCG